MSKARMRMAYIFTTVLLFVFAQLPLFIIFSAINWDPTSVFLGELLGAVTCIMIAGLALAKENYNGR